MAECDWPRYVIQHDPLVRMGLFRHRTTVRIRVVFRSVALIIAGSLLTGTVVWAGREQADVNARDALGVTALERAVNQGDINFVRALIQTGANVNARSSTGRTALSWAALQGRLEIVRALAEAGADLNVKDEQGWTPLTLAFNAGHFAVVQALIKAGANANLDQLRKDVNTRGAFGWPPLAHASNRDDISALIQLGADPNATDNSGRAFLAWAALTGNLDEVRAMIEAGADVNVKDKQGWTPLLLASQMGHTAIVQALVQAGADPNLEGPAGWNALMQASYFGSLETVRVLIPLANVNYRAKNGITALTLARWGCHLDIVEALTKAGAVIGSEEWRRAPRFDDFPISRIYKGVPAPVDLGSDPTARSYRTRLRQEARKGANFAGHYTVVSWGCGSNCESIAIVDALNGGVYDGIGDERGADFKINSNLMISDPAYPPGGTAYGDNPSDKLPVRYYVWNDHKFKLIYEEACSVIENHQKCGCEGSKESLAPSLK